MTATPTTSPGLDRLRHKGATAVRELSRLADRARRLVQGDLLDEKVFFLHVPKCGGTSVHGAISATCWRPASTTHLLAAPASGRAAEVVDEGLMAFRERVLIYLFEQPRMTYVGGHFTLGEDMFARYGHTWNFITVLRHPVDKWLSQYYYNRYRGSNRQHFAVDDDLETYLDSDEGRALGSDYVAKFAGREFVEAGADLRSDEAIERAISNLEQFSLVGFLDQMDRFAEQFELQFGASLAVGHTNRSPAAKKKKRARSSPTVRERVRELCAPDLRVYEAARKMWLG
jgi:hypothetical protein